VVYLLEHDLITVEHVAAGWLCTEPELAQDRARGIAPWGGC
jgi:hypothetical protein